MLQSFHQVAISTNPEDVNDIANDRNQISGSGSTMATPILLMAAVAEDAHLSSTPELRSAIRQIF